MREKKGRISYNKKPNKPVRSSGIPLANQDDDDRREKALEVEEVEYTSWKPSSVEL